MSKSKRQKKKKTPRPGQKPRDTPQSQEEQPRKFTWIPLWGWVLIFLVPLAISEYMFYVVGRWASMILFPIVWVGFWIAIMQRSGWVILKKHKDE
ncbi:MAG: hypothetical protein DRI52_08605 [Chloroflexi bacterium]|nr:MAG: hypothetical protein DRI52_08605 [Chloroflexota bacterium]